MVERYRCFGWDIRRGEMKSRGDGEWVRYSDYADLERQIAELRTKYDRACKECFETTTKLVAAEAENARLRALPLKDEVERVLDAAYSSPLYLGPNNMDPDKEGLLQPGSPYDRGRYDARRDVKKAMDALLSRLQAGEQEERDGLSEWAGWDKSRDPWGETKHKDAVLEALFRGPWSVEDAAALIGFIDRTWTKRPASPSVSEGGSRNG